MFTVSIIAASSVLSACPPSSPDGPPLCAYFVVEGRACANWNEDLQVDPDDLSDFITDWMNRSPCADIDISGTVDEDDLVDFIAAYFAE